MTTANFLPQKEQSEVIEVFQDPIRFCGYFWPDYNIYDKQREIMYSVRDNYETIVPAGNELGKDFIAGLQTYCRLNEGLRSSN